MQSNKQDKLVTINKEVIPKGPKIATHSVKMLTTIEELLIKINFHKKITMSKKHPQI